MKRPTDNQLKIILYTIILITACIVTPKVCVVFGLVLSCIGVYGVVAALLQPKKEPPRVVKAENKYVDILRGVNAELVSLELADELGIDIDGGFYYSGNV